jgi:predicted peptidase
MNIRNNPALRLGAPLALAAALAACGGGSDTAGTTAAATTAATPAAAPVATSMKSVSTVSRIFADGQKVAYVVVKYDAAVDAASLATDTYNITYKEDSGTTTTRKVVDVWTSDGAFLNHGGVNTVGPNSPTGTGKDTTPVTVAEIETKSAGAYVVVKLQVQSPLLVTSLATDGRPMAAGTLTPITAVTVVQQKDIKSAAGAAYAASTDTLASAAGKVLIREQYETGHYYTDPVYGNTVYYNIYKPQGYQGNAGKYPLVVFVPDAGHTGTDTGIPLMQGNGGTAWADPAWHAAGGEEAFVVTIIPREKFVNDYWEYYADVTQGIMGAVRNLVAAYPEIDADRVYTTGQSMGAMNSLIMMMLDRQATAKAYPSPGAVLSDGRADTTPQTRDLFTAGLVVAGQWDTSDMASMGNSRAFIVSSADDAMSSIWTNKAVARWVTEGHEVVRGWINGNDGFSQAAAGYSYDPAQHRFVIQAMLDRGAGVQAKASGANGNAHLYYVSINAGTGTHDQSFAAQPGGHTYTWKLGFDLPLVKEWVFAQKGNYTSQTVLDAATPANGGNGPRDATSQGTLAAPQGPTTWNPAAGESWAAFNERLTREIPNPTP